MQDHLVLQQKPQDTCIDFASTNSHGEVELMGLCTGVKGGTACIMYEHSYTKLTVASMQTPLYYSFLFLGGKRFLKHNFLCVLHVRMQKQ